MPPRPGSAVTWDRALWLAGAYVTGSLPSTHLVAYVKGGTGLLRAASRTIAETDPHVLLARHFGAGWATAAGIFDVAKAFIFIFVARRYGQLPPIWLASAGTALVVGYCWPPYARRMAGRGLAAAAGVFLVLIPVPMAVAGVTILVGMVVGHSGLASTLGLLGIPVVTAVQGQPSSYVAMGAAVFAIILVRRLEGAGELVRRGVPRARVVYYRVVFDVSEPPAARPAAGSEQPPQLDA